MSMDAIKRQLTDSTESKNVPFTFSMFGFDILRVCHRKISLTVILFRCNNVDAFESISDTNCPLIYPSAKNCLSISRKLKKRQISDGQQTIFTAIKGIQPSVDFPF